MPKICNILFDTEPPPAIVVKASLTGCKPVVTLPKRTSIRVLYDPFCPACERLLLYVMDIGNLEVRAEIYTNHIREIISLTGTVVVPVTIAENGRWMRGCPKGFDEFYRRLVGLINLEE